MEPNMGNRGEDIASKFEIPKQNPKCNEKNSRKITKTDLRSHITIFVSSVAFF